MKLSTLCLALLFFCLAPAPALAQEPAPVFDDLLGAVQLRDNGLFKPHSIYAYFMPADKGRMVVLKDGAEVAEFSWRCSVYTAPKFEIEGWELVKGKNHDLGFVMDQAGQYELAFFTAGKKFYSFPFTLRLLGGNDPYQSKKVRLMDGDWSQFAFLSKTSPEGHGKWKFGIYVRSEDGSLQQSKGQVRLVRLADNKVVAVGSSNYRREASWTKQSMELQKPGKKNDKNEYYSNQTLYANKEPLQDGDYLLKYLQDGKVYGSYKFSVAGGKPQDQGRQVRGSDPLRFLEGGGKTTWIPKS